MRGGSEGSDKECKNHLSQNVPNWVELQKLGFEFEHVEVGVPFVFRFDHIVFSFEKMGNWPKSKGEAKSNDDPSKRVGQFSLRFLENFIKGVKASE